MQRETSLARERRLLLSRQELACAAAIATAANPALWKIMQPAFRARFGAERTQPSRTVVALVVRCLRRALRARLRRTRIVPDGSPRCGWNLQHDPTWNAVHESQEDIFACAASVARMAILKYTASVFVNCIMRRACRTARDAAIVSCRLVQFSSGRDDLFNSTTSNWSPCKVALQAV